MQTQRLMKEYRAIKSEKVQDIHLAPIDDTDLFHWAALIRGPAGTPFENGVFRLSITVPTQYPLEPPQVRFVTKVFHPNVHFKVRRLYFRLDVYKSLSTSSIDVIWCENVLSSLSFFVEIELIEDRVARYVLTY
jgi:ubiquitin-protein ligase